MAGNKPGFLMETALLTHGVSSVTQEDMLSAWEGRDYHLAWVDNGFVRIGGMNEYLPFRLRAGEVGRIDCYTLEKAERDGFSGALTASGTMEVCKRMGIPLAVTCGMGGIGDIKGEELCPDLPALRDIPVTLLCTSPKDMLDRPATFSWLKSAGVAVLCMERDVSTGYIFTGCEIALDGAIKETLPIGKMLILNEIPQELRLSDITILQRAVEEGHKAEAEGKYFHPAVNGEIDRLSRGYSSRLQFEWFIKNGDLAAELTSQTI
ncbi:MAG: pseudouridine-5'-phosphate glycosidase [Clostridiaceae bacterium]|nr:pseudouridine-5'-phosphate glycosidase [Clostridiaceae bacterium]